MNPTTIPSGGAPRLHVLLADDEALARSRLRQMLSLDPEIEIVAECVNGRDTLAAIATFAPDLVLLDIHMPEVDGMTVAQSLRLQAFRPLVIFVTAHAVHAPAAFDVDACDYLLKPCSLTRLREALARARAALAGGSAPGRSPNSSPLQRLIVRTGERMIVVSADEIDWIESANNYVILHAGRAAHILRETLTELEARLEPRNFLRVSRSAAVNPSRVREIVVSEQGGHVAVLVDGTRIPITRRIREVQALLETS